MAGTRVAASTDARCDRAFTLVELLVVIGIIMLLMALLLPAVQSAREAARLVTCRNNAKQLAQGSITHLELQGYFPSGGWGWLWSGEPDRGFGKTQPGGWAYAVLPFIEQKNLHQLGAGLDNTARVPFSQQRISTAVRTFYCPSRRKAKAYPSSANHVPRNCPRPTTYAKTDYAINIGDTQYKNSNGSVFFFPGPPSSCLDTYPKCLQCDPSRSQKCNDDNWYAEDLELSNFNGLSSHRSEIRGDEVEDGFSTTLLLAEKYLNPDSYETGEDAADNGDAWQGRDWDTARWTVAVPRQDRPGQNVPDLFGSAHASGINAAACDGSVRGVRFDIDPNLWKRLGNRRNTQPGNPQIPPDNTPTDWPR
jgi:type II secretory pathway pseudopilin PulG